MESFLARRFRLLNRSRICRIVFLMDIQASAQGKARPFAFDPQISVPNDHTMVV